MTNQTDDQIDPENEAPAAESPPPSRLPNGKFAPGFTGNPKGRPRKPKGREMLPRIEDLHNVLSTEMLKEHDYKLNGEEKSLPYVVLLLRQMKIDALKGDKMARRLLLEWWTQYLKDKYVDKMKFFETARDTEFLDFLQVLELDQKM